jgi:predicted nucleic acid-binding protein
VLDTSVAIALTVTGHTDHVATFEAVGDLRLGLAGHAAYEAYSVLTRLPAPARRTPATVARLLAASFPHTRFLDADAAALLADLPARGIAGGSVYDALVAAADAHHRLRLATRDRRALDTYRALHVDIEMVD